MYARAAVQHDLSVRREALVVCSPFEYILLLYAQMLQQGRLRTRTWHALSVHEDVLVPDFGSSKSRARSLLL